MSHSSSKERVSLIASCRGALLGVALLSGLINILLSGFPLHDGGLRPGAAEPQHSDLGRPVGHHLALFLFQGLFDMLRGRIFARVGAAVDEDPASASSASRFPPAAWEGGG